MKTHIQTQWDQCLQIISDNLQNEEAYRQFFEPIEVLSYRDNKLELGVPSSFVYERLESEYLAAMFTYSHVHNPCAARFESALRFRAASLRSVPGI